MSKYRLELVRLTTGEPRTIAEQTIEVTGDRSPEGEENLGIELMAEFKKALEYSTFLDEVPDLGSDLVPTASRKIDFSQWWDVRNTENLWLEISNTLADVRFLLAQARSYKALEPPRGQSSDRGSEQLKYYAHFAKMYHLNLSIFGLVKIQDLVVRLLFENFGGALIAVDQSDEDWERKLTLKDAKKGLTKKVESGELSAVEHKAILDALDEPSRSHHQETVVAYRNRLVHRVRPSVDHGELFTELEDRVGTPILDSDGNVKGRRFSIKARPSRAEFEFDDLYMALLDYLRHVIEMLSKLKAIPRFA
jgi:hypothetical protein